MIRCPNCKSIKVKVLNLNFAERKPEGMPAAKAGISKKQFHCWTCEWTWDSDPEAEKLYFEYAQLKNETTVVVHNMRPGGKVEAQYIDPDKLMRRIEIANLLTHSYQHTLDLEPGDWYEIFQDAH